LVNELRLHGLVPIYREGYQCGYGDVYRLAASAPVPTLLHTVLTGAALFPPEGPWPEFARTEHPIDWPALLDKNPSALVPNHSMLAANFGPSWDSIARAYRLLATAQAGPVLDVCLWVEPDAEISVEPLTLQACCTTTTPPPGGWKPDTARGARTNSRPCTNCSQPERGYRPPSLPTPFRGRRGPGAQTPPTGR
jgi:hypothetical protein